MINERLTTEYVINRVKTIHGNKYDYSKVNYINANTKVIIACSIHGDFEMTISSHYRGRGCRLCGIEERSKKKTLSTEQVITKFKKLPHVIDGNYSFEKVNYIKTNRKVTITCNKDNHGDFEMRPNDFQKGQGCPKCGRIIQAINSSINTRHSTEQFIEDALKKQHVIENGYTFEKTVYENAKSNITATCPKHGDFTIEASKLKEGFGCRLCGKEKHRIAVTKTQEQSILELTTKFGHRYDFSKFIYNGYDTKGIVICKEHGEFQTSPANLKEGINCPACSNYGFKLDQPAIMYYIRVQKYGLTAYKIGITNNTVKKRFSNEVGVSITELRVFEYEYGAEALKAEQQILSDFTDARWTGENLLINGNTEMFNYDIFAIDF